MNVLIVESDRDLGQIWSDHIARQGCRVTLVGSEDAAAKATLTDKFQVIILDLDLEEGSALAFADLASYRQPDSKILFVTKTTFFSDGSIFQHVPNACGFMGSNSRPDDLAAVVHHHASTRH
ncbi:response regulator [Nereida sp. MMG025]|uniref:response regulator n=1 Tax=Nereida sp. MMG025 TaxID=2909981 RepID=UPI001F1E2006|nr:response regulator [Nereida sp. MMG025]MCF6444910.1 response regulator [Nereida sp. MMG025]